MSAGATLRGADALERLERLSIGETLEIETTGVPLWNIPAEIRRARRESLASRLRPRPHRRHTQPGSLPPGQPARTAHFVGLPPALWWGDRVADLAS